MVGRVAHIPHRHNQIIAAIRQLLRHLAGKRQVAPAVIANFPAVQINRALLVHGAEMKKSPRMLRLPVQKRPPVPERLPRFELPAHAGEHTFRRKRNEYGPLRSLRPPVIFRNRIGPVPVQAPIARPVKERTRIFLQHMRRI